eukprot:7530609-Pyramimonas_sp.AAC.1
MLPTKHDARNVHANVAVQMRGRGADAASSSPRIFGKETHSGHKGIVVVWAAYILMEQEVTWRT